MVESVQSLLVDALRERALPLGGFVMAPGRRERADATAWGVCALARLAPGDVLIQPGRDSLRRIQTMQGVVPLTPETPAAWWPTPLALLAWDGAPEFDESRKRAVGFLLASGGITYDKDFSFDEHDSSIQGWPWITETYSWVEPTSIALLSLRLENATSQPRFREGVRMVKDRMIETGGWNYGNIKVFGKALLPTPAPTGMALCALRGEADESFVAKSLDYLGESCARVRTPISLAWSIMGLSAWGRRPDDADALIRQSLALQTKYGPFDTGLLAQLGMAASNVFAGGEE